MSKVVQIEGGMLMDEVTGEFVGETQTLEGMADEYGYGAPLQGSEEQLSFELGSQYNLSHAVLKLGAVPPMTVLGQYQEGDRVRVLLEVEIESIAFPPIKSNGQRIGTERRHIGQVLNAQPAPE